MIAVSDTSPGSRLGPLPVTVNLISLALLVYGITAEVHPGLGGRQLAATILLAVAVVGWLGWVVSRVREVGVLAPLSLAVMGVAGGGLTGIVPLGMVFVGVGVLGACIGYPPNVAAAIGAPGVAAALIAVGLGPQSAGVGIEALAAGLTGAVMGISRRQVVERHASVSREQVAEARAEAEAARAELLAGRNHLARELHDVLAHSLSALSLQLEALDAVMTADAAPPPAVREQLDRTKRLVREGLDEARGAVRALREDTAPLPAQLAQLAARTSAELQVEGEPRPLSPEVSLALYRAAQEALTNVTKHAPGARAEVKLVFAPDSVNLCVGNSASPGGRPGDLADTGGGYGLQGIRERILLVGGRVDAGPAGGGWVVRAEVPA